MPINIDGTKRWVEMQLLVPGTPEQVWHAVATGPGYAAWFVKGDIEPRVGGQFKLDFGEGVVTAGEVTAWDPPHRIGYVERDWQPGAPPVATEITIVGREGNQCVLRMVHTLFTSSGEWDDQVEGFENGWPGFFAILRLYLAHFPGATASSFIVFAPAAGDARSTWRQITDSLGLVGANVGDRRGSSDGPEPWSGIVEHIHQDARQRWTLVRLDDPAPGAVLVGVSADAKLSGAVGTNVSVCRYFYGNDPVANVAQVHDAWREWLATTFAASTATA
jgi:uncharacterized protein YndB with AHSA1/START domain